MNARRLGQVGVDACLIALAYYLAFVLRFDAGHPGPLRGPARRHGRRSSWWSSSSLFAAFGLYSKLWRFVDQTDFESIVKAVVVSSFVLIGRAVPALAHGRHDPPRGVIALDFLLTLALVGGARFLVRAAVERPLRGRSCSAPSNEVLIVGAGNGGQQVALELRRNPELSSAVIGFVDDDPRKQGMLVVGPPRCTAPPTTCRASSTTPSPTRWSSPSPRRRACCARRSSPPAASATSRCARCPPCSSCSRAARTSLRQVREVQVEDVLGREPVRVEIDRVGAYLRGRVVLVTGAGGSIGSELCRQIARVKPKRLVLVDHAENNLFEIRRAARGGAPLRPRSPPCSPTARTPRACASCSRRRSPRSSSTPPPTSTCR